MGSLHSANKICKISLLLVCKSGSSMSDKNKTVESQEACMAPEVGGDNTPGVSDGEIPNDPPVVEKKASPSKGSGELDTSGGGRKSSNGADGASSRQAENNEFILVEDVDSGKASPSVSLEGNGGHEDDVTGVKDEEEGYGDKVVSAEQRDIHDVVNDVLDTKLESFQAQIQKMFTMMQGTMGGSPGKAEEGMDDSVEEPEDLSDLPVQSGSKEADGEPPEQPQFKHQQKEWKEFLGRVSTILDLDATSVKSVLDETVGSAEKVAEYLPAEGVVKNSWGQVKGKRLLDVTEGSNNALHYQWPAGDIEQYGNVTDVNPDLVRYLRYASWGAKPSRGLNGMPKRLNNDLRGIEGQFRYQTRIMSYATYFTAALGKMLAAEQLSEKDKVEELLKNLGQCLIDSCDTSVYGCASTTRSIRRLYIDALEISGPRADCDALGLPLAKKLFPQTQLSPLLLNFGINLEEPHLSKRRRGRGSWQREGLARGSGRGFTPSSRGTHPRGEPSPARGAMKGRGGLPSRKGNDPTRESLAQSPSRSRGVPPRVRGAYRRGSGTRGTRSRGWQPRNRGRGRGRSLKRGPHDDSSVAEKHRRIGSIPTMDHTSHYKGGERGEGSQRSFSPCERDRGVDYQSVPDSPSPYYRSSSDRESPSPRTYSNEGWY